MPHSNHKNPLVTCPECGDAFELTDPRKVFCCPSHKRAWNNRMLSRGGALMLLAMASRQGRSNWKGNEVAKMALTEFRAALDEYAREDKAAGRPAAIEVLRSRYRRLGIGGIEMTKKPARASGRVRPRAQETSSPA